MRFGRAGLYIGFVSNGMFCWPLPCGSSPGASLFGCRKCLAVMLTSRRPPGQKNRKLLAEGIAILFGEP